MKRTKGENVFVLADVLLLAILCVACLYPFLYAIFVSLSEPRALGQVTGFMYKPAGFSLNAYESVLRNHQILTG